MDHDVTTEDSLKQMLEDFFGPSHMEGLTLDTVVFASHKLGSHTMGDSLDQVEFTMAIEDAFQITIGDDEAEKACTVRELIDLIDLKQLEGRHGTAAFGGH